MGSNQKGKKSKKKKIKRKVRGTPKSQKTVVLVKFKNQKSKKKRMNYSLKSMENALSAINNGLSLRKAAAAYNIPISILGRKKNIDSTAVKKKCGPPTILAQNEEMEIVNWILYRAEHGYLVTKTELLDSVQKYVAKLDRKTPFPNNRPSRHWFEAFKKRHPQLSFRKYLSTTRASVTKEDIQECFIEQERYLKSKNLLDISPNRIFNCDESNIILCPESEKVLTEKGSATVYKIVDAGKESLTVLFMHAADGTRAPPMIMYPYKAAIPKNIVANTPSGWGIGLSDNGWMTGETFYEYITNVFFPWLVAENIEFPVLIYMDNHSSHLNIPLVSICRERQIEIIMLIPNSTHIMQPLDISFFHPFKDFWRKSVVKWKNKKNVTRIKKEDFPLVLKYTLDNMESEKKVVVSGFRGSGLYPFNSSAIDYDILKKRKKKESKYNQQQSHQLIDEDKKNFVQMFEEKLSLDILSEFKIAALSGSWTGEPEKKDLFCYWLQITQESTGT